MGSIPVRRAKNMHSTQYRPTKSQQLAIAALLPKTFQHDTIVVHHVIEDSFTALEVQIEYRSEQGIKFSRVRINADGA